MSYIKDCYEKISELEENNDIYSMEICGIEIWRSLRIEIGYKYYSQFTNTISQINNSKIDKSLLKDLYFAPKNKKIIFQGNKKILQGDKYIDPITEKFIDNNTVTVDSMSFAGKYYNLDITNHYFTRAKGIINKLHFWKIEEEKIQYLYEEINKVWDYQIISIEELKKIINNVISQVHYYMKVFTKIKPLEVILTPSYLNIPAVIACNKLGIKTTEIQYALTSQFHIGYATQNKKQMTYYPDELLVWSNYWNKDYLFYTKVKVFNHLLNSEVQMRKKKKILIVSQEVVREKVLDFALKLQKMNLPYEIVLRKHPWDSGEYPDNLTVSNEEKKIIEEINESEVVITVFSTVFYEALYMKCKVLLIDDELNDVFDEDISRIVIKSLHQIPQMIDEYSFEIKGIFADE